MHSHERLSQPHRVKYSFQKVRSRLPVSARGYFAIHSRHFPVQPIGPDLFHPLHPNISMYILHTVLFTFPKVLARRICLTIKRYFFGDHFL